MSKLSDQLFGNSSSGRTDLSRRSEQRSIDQRVRNGDLRPGQRSLNEPYNGN